MSSASKYTFAKTWRSITQNFTEVLNSIPIATYSSYRWWHVSFILTLLIGGGLTLFMFVVLLIIGLRNPTEFSPGEYILMGCSPLFFFTLTFPPLCYWHLAYRPRTIHRRIRALLATFPIDSPILHDRNNYTFTINGYSLKALPYKRYITQTTYRGETRAKTETRLFIQLFFEYDEKGYEYIETICHRMFVYIADKPATQFLHIGYYHFLVDIPLREATSEKLLRLLDELDYMIQRFRLHAITLEEFDLQIQQLHAEQAKKAAV